MIEELSSSLPRHLDYAVFVVLIAAGLVALRSYLRRRTGARQRGWHWLIFAGVSAACWWPVNWAGEKAQQGIRDLLVDLAPLIADQLEQGGHHRITLQTPPDDPGYLALIETQRKLLRLAPHVSDIYTMRATSDGKVVLVVDSETDYDRNGRIEGEREQRTPIGKPYPEVTPEIERALRGEALFEFEPVTDEWGTWITAWVPLHRPDGSVEAAMGVDFSAEDWEAARLQARVTALGVLGGLILLAGFGLAAYHRVRAQLAALERAQEEIRDGATRTRLMLDSALEAVVTTDENGRVEFWNQRAESLFGWPAAEAIGRDLAGLIVVDDERAGFTRDLRSLVETGPGGGITRRIEVRARRRDGVEIRTEFSPTVTEVGGRRSFSAFIRDVTERLRAEAALRESEGRFRVLFENVGVSIMLQDAETGAILQANRRAIESYGLETLEELQRFDFWIEPPYSAADVLRVVHRAAREGPHRFEWKNRDRQGRVFWEDVLLDRITVDGIMRVIAIAQDITERKQAETEMRRLAERLARSQEIGKLGIWEVDLATGRIDCSDQALAIFGHDRAGPKPDRNLFRSLVHPEDLPGHAAGVDRAVRTGQTYINSLRIIRPDGVTRNIQMRGEVVRDDSGRVTGLSGTVIDVTDLVVAEEARQRSRRQFEALFESAVSALLMIDEAGCVRLANRQAEEITGRTRAEMTGQPLLELLASAGLLPPGRTLPAPDGEVRSLRLTGRRRDGSEFAGDLHLQALDSGPEGGVVVQIDDVTERERARRTELRAQRMESVGTLAGGIAHDLNNALAPIAMGLELLRARYPQNASLIDTMEKCTRRGAGMVKQLLTFARGTEGERRSLQPRRIIDEMAQIIRSAFPKNITLEVELAPGLWDVMGDATQLHQVLLNLCVNARDAMPDGGTLAIEAANAPVDGTFASGTEGARAGNFVRWIVRDTGTGMPPEVIQRIFDPFFTTKEQGKGTGLGLSTVLGIVRSHEGFLRVESKPGLGSAFEIYLPAAAASATAAAAEEARPGVFRGNGETILVVDDEDTVREISRTVLTGLNFNVLLAGDGTEALVQVADHPGEIRLVITDYDMPHMNGQMLVPALRRMIPEARIVLASGTLDEQKTAALAVEGVDAILDKPFSQAKLVEALQRALDRSRP